MEGLALSRICRCRYRLLAGGGGVVLISRAAESLWYRYLPTQLLLHLALGSYLNSPVSARTSYIMKDVSQQVKDIYPNPIILSHPTSHFTHMHVAERRSGGSRTEEKQNENGREEDEEGGC